ncbi:serine protease inhibitor 42Dd [Drosophila grimshawi]|uniref:GH11073 n=1 Tax=Drosophila grimshawi TaxID=7222 RepID=B4JCI1_DROGR|nr:serine protease inhibitor 42Dd [Drosophila grimshawi]XP_032592288.1 serine protease inhibitor 42Dd [Drosophila grimshawi]EDW03135.1 GH11073 [Drosophila grimshawi]
MSAAPIPTAPGVPQEINLGAEIFHNIAIAAADENVIISPILLEASLALLYLGSDGTTAAELEKLLKLKQRFASNAKMANFYAAELTAATGDQNTRIQLQNRLLLQANVGTNIADDFQKIAQTYFHATAECLDLQQSEKLNRYITDNILASTGGGNWGQSLQSIGSQASQLLLLLAARLQSKWFLPFSAYRTGFYEFHSHASDTPKQVLMLFDEDMFVKYAELRELNARVIELPYEHADELAMLLILPNKHDVSALAELETQLRTVDLGALQQRMQMESVQVLVPKFSIDFECSLRQALKQLGFTEIFGSSANFKHLHSAANLPIVDVLQKLRIDLNESGSGSESPQPAAGYKPIVISNSSRQKFFRADHPFFFAIRGENVTHFMGHLVSF